MHNTSAVKFKPQTNPFFSFTVEGRPVTSSSCSVLLHSKCLEADVWSDWLVVPHTQSEFKSCNRPCSILENLLYDMIWYPFVFPAFQLVVCDLEGEERTAENMEVSDGLLLQVNNGEQWCNRWKHPNDDSVSHRPRSTIYVCNAIRHYHQHDISCQIIGV